MRKDRVEINTILKTLLKNREILKSLHEGGQSHYLKQTLNEKGYNSSFMTHQVKFESGAVGIFCFEYGLTIKENNLIIITLNG